jgi:hypothetical protein
LFLSLGAHQRGQLRHGSGALTGAICGGREVSTGIAGPSASAGTSEGAWEVFDGKEAVIVGDLSEITDGEPVTVNPGN